MKRKVFISILAIEALLCVILRILQASFSGVFSAVMAFPFEQIGLGLRVLSLSGGIGNAVAIMIYFALCLLPVAILLITPKKRELRAEDGLLGLLSLALFAVLYLMINPGAIGTMMAGLVGHAIGKAALGVMVYSVLCGYFVLRVLRLFSVGGTDKLVRYMSVMLHLLNILFVYVIFVVCFDGLLNSIAELQAGNAGNEQLLGASYVFLAVQFIVDALPYVLNVFVVFAALQLLRAMQTDRYSIETVGATEQMSRLCTVGLGTMVLTNIGFNLLQLLLVKSLLVVNNTVQIPIFSISFVLAALLLTRLVAENKQLKDDNDMFV